MECNPLFAGVRDGYRVGKGAAAVQVSSKGFADDTWTVSQTKAGLWRMHQWVCEFMRFNHLDLHPKKTELVGREPDGTVMDNAATSQHCIRIAGEQLVPSLADRLRNLGVLMCMGLDWSRQAQAISQSIHRYCHLVEQYRLSVSQAVAFLNGYLLPKLEYGLRYVQCSAQQLQQWDKRVVQCVCRAARMARRMGVAAAACITGVLLPSQLHTVFFFFLLFFVL